MSENWQEITEDKMTVFCYCNIYQKYIYMKVCDKKQQNKMYHNAENQQKENKEEIKI